MSTATVMEDQGIELTNSIRDFIDALPDDSRKTFDGLMEHFDEGGTLGDLYGVDEDKLEAVYSVAHTMYGNGRFGDALIMFRFLTLMDYSEKRFWMGLGATQQMTGHYQDAVQAYAYATMLDIDDPKPQVQAGYCLMQMDEFDAAQQALEGALLSENIDTAGRIQAQALLDRIEREELEAEES